MKQYYAGCAALGLTAGFLVGGSSSPVVQYVLPLLFALMGGAAAILALAINPNLEDAQRRFQIVGIAAVVVALPFLLASAYASLLRTGESITALVPRVMTQPEVFTLSDGILRSLDPEESIELLLLNRDLELLKVPESERRQIIGHIAELRIEALMAFVAKREKLLTITQRLGEALEMVMMEEEYTNNSNLEKLLLDLASYRATIEGLGTSSSRAERNALVSIKANLTNTSSLYSETITLFTHHSKIAPLVEALMALAVEVPTTGVLTSEIKTEVADSVTRAAQVQRSFNQSPGFSLFAIEDRNLHSISPGQI